MTCVQPILFSKKRKKCDKLSVSTFGDADMSHVFSRTLCKVHAARGWRTNFFFKLLSQL